MTSFSTSESSSCFIATKKWITTFFGWKRKFGEIYLFQFIVLLSLSLSLSLSLFPCLRIGQRCTHTHTHTWAPLTRFFYSSHTHTRTLKHHFPTTHLSRLSFFLLHLHEVKNVFISSLSHTRTRSTRRFKLSLSSTHSHTLSFICFVVVWGKGD